MKVYTDGACEPNPGPGAYGIYIPKKSLEFDGFDPDTTNQRMELLGPIIALEKLQAKRLTIYSDSQYVIKGITIWIHSWKCTGWRNARKQPVANRDLWERLDKLNHSGVKWQWIRGHDGDPGNERADFLARRRLLKELESDDRAFRAAVRGFSRHQDFDPRPYLEAS